MVSAARRASNPQELEDAITEALRENEQGRGFVIECSIDTDEMVHPMVNGGHHDHRIPLELTERSYHHDGYPQPAHPLRPCGQ